MTLVTNGTFDTNTSGWTAGNATLSEVAGRLRVTNSTSTYGLAYQAITVVVGQLYRVQWDAFTGTATPTFRVGNTSGGSDYLTGFAAGAGQSATFTPTQTTIYVACWVGLNVSGDYTEYDNISVCPAYPMEIDETIHLPDLLSGARGLPAEVDDGIGLSDTATYQLGVLVAEVLRLSDKTTDAAQILNALLSESIFTHDAIARGLPMTVTDGIGITTTQAVAYLVKIIEKLGIAGVVGPAFKFNLSITEKLAFADLLARFIGASVVENVQMAELATGVGSFPKTIGETIHLHDAVNSKLLLRAIIDEQLDLTDEQLDLTDEQLVKMIFSATVADGIKVAAAYLAPNGSITTWAMNTRTAAVTEYTNYNFNSFAKLGDKYLGATADGLYELNGDDDAGSDIIANLKSGLAQFAGVHLASFKGAYIATRGGGSYVLRIYTGTGQEYNFAVTTDSMKTARIDMGKGIRARFFAFELISSGQDFDLDSLEFIPLIAKRRV